jgi:hypothetical protein
MKLQIDNLDGLGLRDYTAVIDAAHTPRVTRRLNEPSELRFSLLLGTDLVAPGRGSRVLLGRTNGQDVFTGYITADPEYEFLGWGQRGPMYRLDIVAHSDDVLLDEKRLAARSPFAARSAGDALRQLAKEIVAVFDTSAVQDLDILTAYVPDPQLSWSKHAAAIAKRARASFRVVNGAITFAALGAAIYPLDESDPNFCPHGLSLQPVKSVVNDLTLAGDIEPQAYVHDYFVGDGLTRRFYLSQTPYTKYNTIVLDEEYASATLDQARWNVVDPGGVVSVSGGKLQVSGGNGSDGATTVNFVEKIELGAAWILQHGDVVINASSSGILGGLYLGQVSQTNCLAGFQVTPSGAASQIQALVSGAAAGATITTVAGHHYILTTRIYSQEIYRLQQTFHGAAYPAGSGVGGTEISANVRLVLEVHDIDPTNPASMVAASTVLYDDVIASAPGFCTYSLVNSPGLQCSIAFTQMIQATDTEVRSALPGQSYRTRLVGPLASGGECNIYSGPSLDFFSQHVPALNELIEVRYRGWGRAMARVTNPASIASGQRGIDDGVRAAVRHLKLPPARTSADCENAALAIVTDGATAGCSGKYQTWSDFLPGGAQDIFPGDALLVNVASRNAAFPAIVKEVAIAVKDLAGEHCLYDIHFERTVSEDLAFEFDAQTIATFETNSRMMTAFLDLPVIPSSQVGTTTLPPLTAAAVTQVSSTTASLDAGVAPVAGGGIEVRWSDFGWGPGNDQNLAGRFTTQTFTLPRLAKAEDYFLRQYDASTPPKYSRFSAALHIDYPY